MKPSKTISHFVPFKVSLLIMVVFILVVIISYDKCTKNYDNNKIFYDFFLIFYAIFSTFVPKTQKTWKSISRKSELQNSLAKKG